MLFPCPEGSVVGKSFQSEVEVRLKAKSRCEMRPEVSPEAAKIVSFLKVPAATFDTEDHPSTGQKTSFLNSPGHAVALFWRLRFGKPCLFYRFRPQRLTLKITSAQVSEVSPAAAQIVSFLAVPAATFDIEDHPSTGRKTVSLSSPDHAVSLFRRQPFWEGFWVRSRGFAGRDTQTQPKVQTVHLQAKSWCELSPKAAKPPFFKDSGRDVWHWRSLQRRSKNGVIELARPCCFPVPEAAFLGRLLGQKSWFCRSWYPNATEGANGVFRRQLEVQIAPQSCKTFFFYRFRPQRLTLKITPAQVEKRCHWARQTMLFPCSGGSLFGKAFGSEVVVLPVVISKRNRRCQRCISKAIGGANCTPKLQNLFFYRFRAQRLTLKITPAQVSEVSPAAAQIVSFLAVPAATFDTEDHPSTGQKMGSFSSPGHAVSLFWRLRFGKPWRQAMLFPCPEGSVVGKSFQSEVEVRLKAKSRCEMRPEVSPEAAKIVSFLKVPAATFDTEDTPAQVKKWAPSARQAMLFRCFGGCVLGSLDARPCCFPVPKEALLGSLSSQKSRCVSKLSPGAKWGPK